MGETAVLLEKEKAFMAIQELDDASSELQNCELHLVYSIGSLEINRPEQGRSLNYDAECIAKHLLGAKGNLQQATEMLCDLDKQGWGLDTAQLVVRLYGLVQASRQVDGVEKLVFILNLVRQARKQVREVTERLVREAYGKKI